MKNYTITVNGVAYQVTVEESQNNNTAPAAPAQTPVAAAEAPVRNQAASVKDGVSVDAPMPGTILDIKVAEGAKVSSGDVLIVLEAMKMENDIVAPKDGTVASINVNKGDSVEAGQALITIN